MTQLPKDYEGIVYQIIRPTGLLDPVVEVRPTLPETFEDLKKALTARGLTDMPILEATSWSDTQIVNLMKEIQITIDKKQRILVTTLTKKMAEELSEYLSDHRIKAKYLHSDIDTVERVKILRELRLGLYDVLVGINLLREGLDLPEVSLVAILDADKEGFLRSQTSLIQTSGRAARHKEGKVIMYADKITDSMYAAITETRRRRAIQEKFNTDNKITPQSIVKEIKDQLSQFQDTDSTKDEVKEGNDNWEKKAETYKLLTKSERKKFLTELQFQMQLYADMLEFERAAQLRDLAETLK